ncbi:MAG: histidine phosphatase family protein [Geminicoccaceae bacterium]
MIRHAPTCWSQEGRLQGRADPPLSPEGETRLGNWCLPAIMVDWALLSSPLKRCRQTASHFGDYRVEDALIEMNWGRFEGERLEDLRNTMPEAMAKNEARGFDFRPPDGESPRDVMDRLRPLIARSKGRNWIWVTHKGVIRSALALATGWLMESKAPATIGFGRALLFSIDSAGDLNSVVEEVALEP